MSRLMNWDALGEHKFTAGVDHGVYYDYDKDQGKFVNGVEWNGLTTVSESPSGAEANDQYADNIKYLSLRSAENFGGTIEAFTYPDAFEKCDGIVTATKGVKISGQNRRAFGFSYRVLLGNDVDGMDAGEEIHLVYMATVNPSEKSRSTVNDSPEPTSLSWEFTTTPVSVNKTVDGKVLKPTAHVVVKSTDFTTEAEIATYNAFLDVIYGLAADATLGTSEVKARLPLPDEVIELLGAGNVGVITLDKHTATVAVGDTITLVATTDPADAEVTWTSDDESDATVAAGVVEGVAEGTATITASITVGGQTVTDTCHVTITPAG